jgi:nucleotide-binding universal stress UspA family protein
MKVLYATDAFPAALDAGVALERWFDPMKVRVTVLSVTHTGSLIPPHLAPELDPKPVRRDQSVEIAMTATARLRDAGFEANPQVAEGHPGREIVAVAERGAYDLVVMGAGSHSWLKTHLLGSVSNYVVHSSPSSVMVVHDLDDGIDNRMLVAVDGSVHSDRAVTLAAGVLDPRRCTVEVLSVASVLAPVIAPVPGAVTMLPLNDEERIAALEVAERATESAAEEFRRAGFEVTPTTISGAPGPTIVDRGLSGGSDLVVVGARGHGPLMSAVLGSVSDPVVRRSRAALVAR